MSAGVAGRGWEKSIEALLDEDRVLAAQIEALFGRVREQEQRLREIDAKRQRAVASRAGRAKPVAETLGEAEELARRRELDNRAFGLVEAEVQGVLGELSGQIDGLRRERRRVLGALEEAGMPGEVFVPYGSPKTRHDGAYARLGGRPGERELVVIGEEIVEGARTGETAADLERLAKLVAEYRAMGALRPLFRLANAGIGDLCLAVGAGAATIAVGMVARWGAGPPTGPLDLATIVWMLGSVLSIAGVLFTGLFVLPAFFAFLLAPPRGPGVRGGMRRVARLARSGHPAATRTDRFDDGGET